ncbi:MAG TPA: AsmA-like C-terminal region-containing protein, partial [Isosphaeraceae bacterium]|nr:AsmA-like C-terminal region-containing protein [Isosphaeraceae bacterium]
HGVKLPEELAGRLSMQAKGVIPLRALSQPHQYVVHGQAVVNEAVAAGLSLGRLATRLDLDEGTLVLTELRGRLADKSKGAAAAATEQEEPVPAEGPLPVGSYRGELRADLAEAGGRLTTTVEAHRLPAGALAELALPKSVSLAGRISATARAEALVASAGDPMSWTAKGRAESDRLAYFRGTEADPVVAESVATSIALEEGRLVLTDLSAKLGEQPLRAQLEVGLASPHPFTARCEAVDANLSDLIALVPGAPAESPVSGALTAQVEAQGTVAPWQFTTHGTGRVDALRAGPVPIGAVPFRWTTADDAILFTPIEARPFGGRIVGQVRVNEMGRGSIEGSAQLTGIDTEQLTKSVPRAGLAFTGKADGRATFTIPASGKPLEARVHLSAPKLTAQGMPAESLRIEMLADRGKLTYDVFADSLGGTVRFQGSAPLDVEPARSIANAKLKVEGFSLAQLWQAVNRTGPLARLDGTGTLDASLHTPLAAFALRATGVAEFQDLHWGGQYPLGHIRGVFAMTPQLWRVEPLTGHLLGGPSQGAIWGDTPAQGPHHLGFDLAVDRASLSQALGMLPTISRHISGFGTLRMAGRFDEALHATAELHVANAKAYGLPLTSLHVPAELTVMEGSGNGTLHLHRWSARLAGGHLTGDGHFRIGEDRAFRAEILLDDLELETLARIETDARRPASGKVSGRIDLTGPNPADLKKLKGKVVLDLDDAAVVELPVFKEIDRFLGAARGGVFEDGDIVGTISNGQLMIDELTLEGRAVQLIGSGTVGFDGQLNLVMVVNTTQIISETGQALVSLIPGLRDGRGRGSARMASYFSNRLLKFRVGGTLRSPSVNLDPSIVVNDAAVNFFGDVFKVPSDMLR